MLAVTVFLSQPARLLLSLKQPQSPERWGQMASFQCSLSASPCSLLSKGSHLPACCWRGKNVWHSQGCWQQPCCLAPKSEPSGGVREVSTVPRERQRALVAAPACRITGHRQDAGTQLQRGKVPAVALKTQHVTKFMLLPLVFVNVPLGAYGIHWSGWGARNRGRKGKLLWERSTSGTHDLRSGKSEDWWILGF